MFTIERTFHLLDALPRNQTGSDEGIQTLANSVDTEQIALKTWSLIGVNTIYHRLTPVSGD